VLVVQGSSSELVKPRLVSYNLARKYLCKEDEATKFGGDRIVRQSLRKEEQLYLDSIADEVGMKRQRPEVISRSVAVSWFECDGEAYTINSN
jgi:hypothetical protein